MTPEDRFTSYVDELIAGGAGLTTDERKRRVDALIEDYIGSTSQMPPDDQVERLSDFIIGKALSSNNKRHMEYPVYTEDQLKKRDKKNRVRYYDDLTKVE